MALGDGLGNANKNAQDLNKNLSATEQSLNNATKASADLTDQTRSLTEELKDQLGIRSRTNETEKALLGVSRDITKSAQENKVALGQQGTISKQLVKEQNQLLSAQREQLIAQSSLSTEQISQAQKISDTNQTRLETLSKIDELQSRLVNTSESERSGILSSIKGYQDRLAANEASLDASLQNADAETQRLALSNQLVAKAQENLAASKGEEATQQRINSAMGVAGNIIAGLSELAGKFGKAFNLDKVATDMKKFTEEAQRAEDELAKLEGREAQVVSRTAALGVGLKSAFNNLGSFLTDPSVVFGAIMHGFNEVEKEQQNFRRLTGQNADAFRGINGSLTTTSQYLKGMVTLTKELGVNANVAFDSKTVTTVTELVEEMGMAGKEAAQLAKLSKLSGTNLKSNLKAVEGQFKSFVKTNGVALNFGDVLNDIGNVSAATAISLGNNPQKIGQAAMEAKKLGLTLEQVDNIASSLLDFETSIQAELEAELLTGKSLNLEKARELALANDLEGVAKEIGNNQAILSAFATGNRKEQEATAKAMGMSRNDMAKMIMDQQIQGGLSVEQAAAAADISLEEAKRLTTQQQITESMEKMAQAIAPILSGIASLLSNSFVLYTTMGTLAAVYITKLLPAKIQDLVITKAGNIASKALNVIKGATITLMNSEFMVKTKDFVLSKAKVAQDAIINGYMVVRNALMNTAIGRYLALGAAKLVDTVRTWAGVGATAAQATANAGLATSQTALGTTGAAAGGGMAAAGAGLGAFGAAAAPAIPIILAIGAALLMASPAIYAFSFVIEALGNIIIGVLQSLPPIITAIAEGFTMFLGAITFEKAAALPLVGIGLVALAAGVVAMAAVTPFLPLAALGIWGLSWALEPLTESMAALGPNLQMISTGLVSLTGIAPTLFSVASGLGAISVGLASMAVAGFMALPIIGALTALGTVSGALGSIFGGGEESSSKDDGSLKKVEEKLDQLISIVSAGGDVYIDGSKVGKTLQLASSKMG